MVKIITGTKGTGKTKVLIDMINSAAKSTNGYVVCIDKSEKLSAEVGQSNKDSKYIIADNSSETESKPELLVEASDNIPSNAEAINVSTTSEQADQQSQTEKKQPQNNRDFRPKKDGDFGSFFPRSHGKQFIPRSQREREQQQNQTSVENNTQNNNLVQPTQPTQSVQPVQTFEPEPIVEIYEEQFDPMSLPPHFGMFILALLTLIVLISQ